MAQTLFASTLSLDEIASDLYKSVDALADLIYLIRLSLGDPETTSLYLGFADDEIKSIRPPGWAI